MSHTRPQDFPQLRAKFTDRGLFLLTIGHLIILGSHAPVYTTTFWCMTDTIGVCMIVLPRFLVRLRPSSRVVIAAAIYAISWAVMATWTPHGVGLTLTKETLFGSMQPSVYHYTFPILPWLSLYLAATALGHQLGQHAAAKNHRSIKSLLRNAAGTALGAAGGLRVTVFWLRHAVSSTALARVVHLLASPYLKQPPSPGYFLTQGSIGLAILYGCFVAEEKMGPASFLKQIAALGETSLFVFFLQWYVYFLGIYAIHNHLPFQWAWPGYFLVSVAIIAMVGWVWNRAGYNRLLTVGYGGTWTLGELRDLSTDMSADSGPS